MEEVDRGGGGRSREGGEGGRGEGKGGGRRERKSKRVALCLHVENTNAGRVQHTAEYYRHYTSRMHVRVFVTSPSGVLVYAPIITSFPLSSTSDMSGAMFIQSTGVIK